MFEVNTILFLLVVTLGAVVQTITGFAMGLIIMAGVSIFAITDIAFAAAVVSFISLVNTSVALRSGYRHVDWPMVRMMILGLMPAVALGILLLDFLSEHYYALLELMLGLLIVAAGISLMISPAPFAKRSGRAAFAFTGALGGLLGGLYSAGGAPLAYFCYRQPMSINVIRFSLLTVFAASTMLRSFMIGVTGQLTTDILRVSALSIPLVILVTLTTSRFVHLVPDRLVRRLVFIVLLIAGLFLISASLASQLQFHP